MKTNLKLATFLIVITMITACGSESDGYQHEDSESNDQDNIAQRVEPGKLIGSLSYGVDMIDTYYAATDGGQTTTVSVTNEEGMDLALSEVNVFSQVQQQSDRDTKNEAGHEVEEFQTSSAHYYHTYIQVRVLEGSGKYTLSIDVSPVE